MNASDNITIFRRTILAAIATAFMAMVFFLAVGPAEATAPSNDDLADARIIRGDSASIRGNNASATREKGESDHILSGSSVGQNSMWYRWTAWESGPIEADVCRSEFDSIIAVYTKERGGRMEKVADNDDGCSARNQRGSSVVFEAKLEETYWIAVSGYSKSSTGSFTLRLSPTDSAE